MSRRRKAIPWLMFIAILNVSHSQWATAESPNVSSTSNPVNHPDSPSSFNSPKKEPSDENVQQILSGDMYPDFVRSEGVAKSIAETILIDIYGREAIAQQLPLVAKLENGIWIVSGTFHRDKYLAEMKAATKNPNAHFSVSGGVAEIRISKKSGCILDVDHGE